MAKALWVCPTCGQSFVSPNMPHSCQVVPRAAHFEGKPELLAVYERLFAAVSEHGPVAENVTKSRITFQTRMRFAGIGRPRRDHLVANFVLTRPVPSDRLRVDHIPPYYYVHRIRLYRPGDVDDELTGWLDEARQVGDQRHLERDWPKVRDPPDWVGPTT
jgi:uncharacterized protein DUF5655